jgi:hypothetical protein
MTSTDIASQALALAQRAADDLAIRKTLARLARAQDDRDRDSYKTCFTERVMLKEAVVVPDWQPREVSVDELTEMYFAAVDQVEFGHHMVFNHVIDIDGDEATCLADLFSIRAGSDGGEPTMGGGRYSLRLRRVDDEWLICERSIKLRYRL